jgi:hypothetical protein
MREIGLVNQQIVPQVPVCLRGVSMMHWQVWGISPEQSYLRGRTLICRLMKR